MTNLNTEMTNLNTEMTDLNTQARELTIDELDSASGGLSFLGVIGAVARIILTGYGIDPYPRKIS